METTSFSHFEAVLRQKAKEKDSSEGDCDFLVATFITETMSSWMNWFYKPFCYGFASVRENGFNWFGGVC